MHQGGAVADTLQRSGAGPIDRSGSGRSWSFVTDGPPLWLVAAIFAILLAVWLAPGAPALVAVMLAAALLLTLALEFRQWIGHPYADRGAGEPDPKPLRQRLDEARTRRIERDRWR